MGAGAKNKKKKLKTKKLKKAEPQEEINGTIEKLLEDEVDVIDTNNLIYAASTIMTLTQNEPSKRSKKKM
jgi:hypothetical protein